MLIYNYILVYIIYSNSLYISNKDYFVNVYLLIKIVVIFLILFHRYLNLLFIVKKHNLLSINL